MSKKSGFHSFSDLLSPAALDLLSASGSDLVQ
jgi:hypothetical protein